MYANFQGSSFNMQNLKKLTLFATLTPLAPKGVVISIYPFGNLKTSAIFKIKQFFLSLMPSHSQ